MSAESLSKALEGLEKERKSKVSWSIGLLVAGSAVLLVGIALAFFALNFYIDPNYFQMAVPLMIVSVIMLFAGTGISQKFRKSLRTRLTSIVFDEVFPDHLSIPNQGLPMEVIKTPGFFMPPDRYVGSDYMQAKYDGVPFEQSRYRLEKRSRGRHGSNYVTYAEGTMYRIGFGRDLHATVKVVEKDGRLFKNFDFGGLEKVETEYMAFNDKFDVYATDKTAAFYLLTPQMQEKIMSFEKFYQGRFYLAFVKTGLYIAAEGSDSSFTLSIAKKITPESVKGITDLLSMPAQFIDEMRLSSYKFKKGAGVDAETVEKSLLEHAKAKDKEDGD
jgi:hypothetical protein